MLSWAGADHGIYCRGLGVVSDAPILVRTRYTCLFACWFAIKIYSYAKDERTKQCHTMAATTLLQVLRLIDFCADAS